MEDLLPGVVGAVLAACAGFVGAWVQGRREHAKWLREKRYDAFVELRHILIELDDADRMQELAGVTGDLPGIAYQAERRTALESRLRGSIAELTFAPDSVQKAATWLPSSAHRATAPSSTKTPSAHSWQRCVAH